MSMTIPIHVEFSPRPRLGEFVRAHRRPIARFVLSELRAAQSTHYVPPADELFDLWLDRGLGSLVDLLARYFETANSAYLTLFSSDLRWSFRDSPLSPEERIARRQVTAANLSNALVTRWGTELRDDDRRFLAETAGRLATRIAAEPETKVPVLLVGDCLMADVRVFLDEGCIADGISIQPTHLGSSNPAELRNQLREHANESFAAVFYSPFTYDTSLELRELQGLGSMFIGRSKLDALAEQAVRTVQPTVLLLSELFEAPIFVHDASILRRYEGRLSSRLKARSTRSTRNRAAAIITPRMRHVVSEIAASRAANVLLFEEAALVAEYGEGELGAIFHATDAHHAAVFGSVVADRYRDRVYARAHLSARKLVVCDLDNTVWDGVIGEGAVSHHVDRQRVLRRLREKGVLLAVASKNDPSNVNWRGGLLSDDDFVHQEISWDPKVISIQRIQTALNLKPKDFVFVDDRADERGMVRDRFPEIHSLDATDPRTWRLLELWGDMLPEPEMDRSRMYKERGKRESFLDSARDTVEDQSALYRQLEIRVALRRAARSELPRVAELVNRTNQFNLSGSRTSLQEVQRWHHTDSFRILVAEVSDKFGDSGIVCVCVLEVMPDEVRIHGFVLSCRVFGYGVEHAVMDEVKRTFAAKSQRILAKFAITPYNRPCHAFLPANGFESAADGWMIWTGAHDQVDCGWLMISATAE